jgi:hypothetical protein
MFDLISKVLLYMQDEVFHWKQAVTIDGNDFTSWDDKITTFPGLYYFSYILRRMVPCASGSAVGNEIMDYRSHSALLGGVLYGLLEATRRKVSLSGANICHLFDVMVMVMKKEDA